MADSHATLRRCEFCAYAMVYTICTHCFAYCVYLCIDTSCAHALLYIIHNTHILVGVLHIFFSPLFLILCAYALVYTIRTHCCEYCVNLYIDTTCAYAYYVYFLFTPASWCVNIGIQYTHLLLSALCIFM